MTQLATKQPPTFLQWIRPPQQARTRESLTRLLDAAEELVTEKGFADTSIVEIAQHAGSSIGGFYRRFRDKEALMHALHQRFCEEARATAEVALDPGRWIGSSASDVLGAFTAFLVQIYRDREGFFRAILQYAMSNPDARRRDDELYQYLSERLAALLRGRRKELAHPNPEVAAALGLRILIGTLNFTVEAQPETLRLSDRRLTDELSRALLAYLGAGSISTSTRKRS